MRFSYAATKGAVTSFTKALAIDECVALAPLALP
jgi:hypothetical protein